MELKRPRSSSWWSMILGVKLGLVMIIVPPYWTEPMEGSSSVDDACTVVPFPKAESSSELILMRTWSL